jgi:iron complex outermembrane receptor protein
MLSRKSLLVSTALVAIALPGAAAAQEQAVATTAESATAEASQDPVAAITEANADSEDPTVIVVTAQRRVQTLIEVPQSISVVGGDTLERQQATSFADYAALVPGLSIDQDNPGEARVILRGINTGSVASTVAIYVDDIPFGSSGGLSNGGVLAGDFDTFDVARVEVLKGPQGTFYGSNALGGVIKFITAEPELGAFTSRGQAGVEFTKNGGTGWLGNAVVNVPLGDSVAVRASGFYRGRPGYIDALGRDANDINDSKSYGGRVSLLAEPTDNLSIRLTALAQNIRVDAPSFYDADPETYDPVNAITGEESDDWLQYSTIKEQQDVDYRLYSGTINWDLGPATLTSVTSYGVLDQRQLLDATLQPTRETTNTFYNVFGSATGPTGLALDADIKTKKFTQEVRLASPDSDTLEWLAGVYYTHEKGELFQNFLPIDLASQDFIDRSLDLSLLGPALGLPPEFWPLWQGFVTPEFAVVTLDSKYKEIAGFGSVTWHASPRFDVTVGARYSHNKQDSEQFTNILGGAPLVGSLETINGESDENVFTWSLAPRYEVNDLVSIYARVAKGYRPGGPNAVPPTAPPEFPSSYDADTIISYEAGVRGETQDRMFGFDASVYYNDWNDIQLFTVIQTNVGPFGVNANGQGARSYGAELALTARPTRGLNLAANLAYVNAKLTDDTVLEEGEPNVPGGLDGDRLPNTPEWSANFSADYEWTVWTDARAYVGGNFRWVSDQFTNGFSPEYRADFGERLEIDGYATVDLRAGVDMGRFNVQLYAKNLFDKNGFTSLAYPRVVPASLEPASTGTSLVTATAFRPRTVGLTAGFEF